MVFALLSQAKAQTSTVHGMISFLLQRATVVLTFISRRFLKQNTHAFTKKHEKHEKNEKHENIEKIIQNFNSMKLF